MEISLYRWSLGARLGVAGLGLVLLWTVLVWAS